MSVHGFNASSSAHTASVGLGSRQHQPQSGVMVAALAIAQPNESSIHFPALITLSLLAHAGTILAIALIMLLLSFFGFSWVNLNPLEMQQRDIEFVIVDTPQQKPRDPNTKNRAQHASRSGGKAVDKKSTALAQRKAGTVSSKAQSQVTPVKASRPQRQPAPQPRQQRQQPQQQPTPPAPPSPPRPVSPPRPRVNTASKSRSSSPVMPPSPMAPTIRTPSSGSNNGPTGPIMPSPSSSSSSSRSSYATPSQISGGSSRGSSQRNPSQGSPSSAGGSGGTGRENTWGSPGGGGGRPGLDALPDPDYGSYMAELQRRIKRNWQPPRAQEDKRVVALFRIGRDGRLLSVSIKQSSGYVEADGAALNAVRLSAPFRPLPVGHTEPDLPVEFTFDYNVYKATRM